MENNRRECHICNKSFSNGKALGGHMKTHLAKLPIPLKSPINNQAPEHSVESTKHQTHSISTSSSSISNPKNPIHNLRALKRNFYHTLLNFGKNSVFDSFPKNPTGKRSKRGRRQFNLAEDNTIFNVAKKKEENTRFNVAEENEEDTRFNTQIKLVYSDLDTEAAETLAIICVNEWKQVEEKYYIEKKKVSENGNIMFECDICHEVFQYCKDLVRHEAIHKKNNNLSEEIGISGKEYDVVNEEVHKCTYCLKFFEFDHVLEEHKTVHLSNFSDSNP
ncbi:putative transcription factor C2H2 family [Medicago truncatula]|uniref:Putative transcription factor C2H2 family n=1 Tax=Medicago truncatula TaxID=3880 RepID=A0A072UTD1_MEDTR|nr:zinc finger protein ZAT1 [Medicago truncatula]KEH32852.1 zinc finger, C2H2 type protein [Medicago truncatula]RHN65367.1 putative transcription factor C2H2 family [Medicago truncatula]